MNDWLEWVLGIGAVIILVVAFLVTAVAEQRCHESGGAYVRGFYGYECIRK